MQFHKNQNEYLERSKNYFLIGVQNYNLGKYIDAEKFFNLALEITPDRLSILTNLSGTLIKLNKFNSALECIEKIVNLFPEDDLAYLNKGIILFKIERFKDSLVSLNKSKLINENNVDLNLYRSLVLYRLRHFEESLNVLNLIFKEIPFNADIYEHRGRLNFELNNLDLAKQDFELAISLEPQNNLNYFNIGVICIISNCAGDSIKYFKQSLKICPHADSYINLGFANHKLKRYEESLKAYDKCLEIENRHAECYNNRAHLLLDMNRPEDALSSVNKAIEFKEAYVQAYVNRGIIYHQLRLPQLSLESYDKALSIDNSFANAYYNKSLLQLSIGDFLDGFKNYQWRWLDAESSVTSGKRNFKEPLWLGGESLQNKTILIYTEQGLGDAIQFCRYIKNLAALGAKVIFEVPSSLFNLFRKLEGVNKLVIKNTESLVYDCQCPLQSLPHAFRTELNTIPCEIPYLFANSNQVANWEKKLGIKEKKRIGIVWSSHSTFKNDHNRSIRLNQFLKALPADKFDYFSLQKEVKDYDIEDLEQSNIKYFPNQLTDFSETAALIECMDLVISTCTSVAHLSGALGKPTWILLSHVPDWRWMYDRGDSPWYPSVKLIRQERPYSWDELLINLKNRLKSQE